MWPFSKIKQSYQEKQKIAIHSQANDLITVSDFDGKLFIAYSDNPLIMIEDTMSSSDILKELKTARNNYINAKLKEL